MDAGTAKFVELARAYEVLSNAAARATYDLQLGRGGSGTAAGHSTSAADFFTEFGDDGNGLAAKLRWAAAQFEQHFPDGTLSLELHEGNGDSGDGQSGSAAHSAALAQPFLSFDRGLVTCSDRCRPHDRWKGGVCWL